MAIKYTDEQKLQLAEFTSRCLQRMAEITSETPLSDKQLDQEISRSIAIAQSAILYWRLAMGERTGLLKIKAASDCEENF